MTFNCNEWNQVRIVLCDALIGGIFTVQVQAQALVEVGVR